MNDNESDEILKNILGLKVLDRKICIKEVQSFKCCLGIMGLEKCDKFIQYVMNFVYNLIHHKSCLYFVPN